jgi:hypothetical protein
LDGGSTFLVRPAVQDKDITDGESFYHHHMQEPGLMVGPEKRFIKAFDGSVKPRPDMVGVCVGFAACVAAPAPPDTPDAPDVIATIACKNPALTLILTRDNRTLIFRVNPADHPLAAHPMSHLELPEGAALRIGDFAKKCVTARVDL